VPNFDTVREIGLRLPGVEESTIHGAFSLKARGKLLACMPLNKSAEPDSLAVRIDLDNRADLLAVAPDVYYVTDHYLNYPMVLVRLSRIHPDALEDLLGMAWRFVTAKKKRSR
jgi:hypothetical protein